MNKNRSGYLLIAFAAALVATLAWRAGANSAAGAGKTPVVGRVDMQKIMTELEEIKERQKEFTAFRDKLRGDVQALDKKVADAQEALKLLAEGTPEFDAKRDELERLTSQLRTEGEFAAQQVDRKKGAIYAAIFRKVTEAGPRFAKQSGIDLLLTDDSVSEAPRAGTEAQITAVIVNRRVLHASESLDVTNDLLRFLDNEYRLAGGGARKP